jgi:hypothetical protein
MQADIIHRSIHSRFVVIKGAFSMFTIQIATDT